MENQGHKEYKYLYQKMLDEDVIRKAYKKLRKGKTKRKEIIEIDAHLDEEVTAMRIMLENTKPPDVYVEHPELAFKPIKHKFKIIYEHGKYRKICKPEIHEQWVHHIIVLILEPIVMATSYRFSCGSLPKRGVHYGKKQMEKWISSGKNIRNFCKIDIRHFYDNIRIDILMRELAFRIKDCWFLHIIRLCLKFFKRGLALGFYISQWLANYLLEPLDKFVTETLGIMEFERYMDDMVFFHNSKKILHKVLAEIWMFLGRRFRLKLKDTYQICKFYYEKQNHIIGRPVDFMGFLFYRNRTAIRKKIMLSATRTAKKMCRAKEAGRGYYKKHISSMLSYMGWFTCSDTYNCYLEHIKPYANVGNLKRIISKLKRREFYNEEMERGTLCRVA